jgi:hypothetical protein
MNRITFTVDENGHLVRVCADREVEVYIVDPNILHDRVYKWSSLKVGTVEEEIGGWPVGHRNYVPAQH